MLRDFSEASKKKILSLVSEVENENICDMTDWMGDRWYDFDSWIGRLNIKNYINDVNSYHRKVIDKNNASKKSIETIFANVSNVNNTYSLILGNIDSNIDNLLAYIDCMNNVVIPSKGMFNSRSMSNNFDFLLSKINSMNAQCLKEQMVQDINGELIFNEDLIYEYLKKDQAELSKEEQQILIEVIAKLQGAVATYETLASYGTDELGVDVLHYVSWLSNDTRYNSFSAVSAHYNEIYVNLLNFMVEQDESSNSFAASLVKASNGEDALTVLGAEYKDVVNLLFGGASLKVYAAKYQSEHTEQYFAKLEANEKESLRASSCAKTFNGDIANRLKNRNKLKEKNDVKYYDSLGNEISKDDASKFGKKLLTLGELRKSLSANVSFYDGTFDTFGDGNVNVVVGRAEAHADLCGGFYVVSEDGKRKFSPGVNAEIGTSITALDVAWDQQWAGDDMFGFNTNVGLTALDAGIKADAAIQFTDRDGKLNPQMGLGAKAEATLVELEGSAGVNVLGGEVGVTGSVSVGIGAHADLGYKDGVFKFDVGASVGLGVSVGGEVDIGGMIDTVSDKAESAWDDLKKGWNARDSWF
ncbi:MAG: hypothetical protein K6B67_04910 [Lachnospiraceae bacterium]|nr:hypothetical protein [Lachnospiraceae bacterium]